MLCDAIGSAVSSFMLYSIKHTVVNRPTINDGIIATSTSETLETAKPQ